MSKVVEFDPSKRQIANQFIEFKKLLESIPPEKVSEMIVYVKTDNETEDGKLYAWAYAPTWDMIGRMQNFLREIEIELYMGDFLDDEDEDEID